MNLTTKLILQVGILFLMMIPGIILKKCKLVSPDFGKGISNLILYVAQPVLVFYAYLSFEGTFLDIWQNILAVFLLSVLAHVLFCVVAIPVFKKAPEARAKMLRLVTIFSNAAFMGIPLIEILLGAENAIYASIYNITFNLFLWTLGVHLCTHEEGADFDGDGDSDLADALKSAHHHAKAAGAAKKVLLHPVTLASVLGLICLICGVNVSLLTECNLGFLSKDLEGFGLSIISDSLAMVKGLVAPLSMVVIGLRVPDIRLSGMLRDVYMYIFLVLRHLALPAVLLVIMKLLILIGLPIGEGVALTTLILASTPSATSATMFAEKYDCDAPYTSRLVIVSTLLSILTMPLLVGLG